MTIIMMIMAAFLALAGVVCVWVCLICLGRGAERLAARPAAIFAVVLFALAAMSAGAALAQTPHHHEFLRDFYPHWKQPGTGVSCCNARRRAAGIFPLQNASRDRLRTGAIFAMYSPDAAHRSSWSGDRRCLKSTFRRC